jgi:hypothetical protein
MNNNTSNRLPIQPKGRNIPTQIKDLLFQMPGLTRAELAQRLRTTMTVVNMTVDAFVEIGKISDIDGKLYLVRLEQAAIELLRCTPAMTIGAIATKIGLSHKFAKNLIDSGLSQDVFEMRGELVFLKGDAPPVAKVVKAGGESATGTAKERKADSAKKKASAIAAQKVKARSELVDLNLRRDALARELNKVNERITVLNSRLLDRRVEV